LEGPLLKLEAGLSANRDEMELKGLNSTPHQLNSEKDRVVNTVYRTPVQSSGERKWDRYRHVMLIRRHDDTPGVEEHLSPPANVGEERAIYVGTAGAER